MDVAALAKAQADLIRIAWAQLQTQRRTRTLQKLESAGFYQAFNADSEGHQIQLLSGRTIEAESITTSGQSAGERVVVSKNGGYRFKAMPR